VSLPIRSIEAFYLRAQLPEPFGWSQAWTDTRASTLVRVTAEDGTEGWGEAGVVATPALVAVIDQLVAPRLVGRDVFDRHGLIDDVAATYKVAGQRGLLLQALSGVDIAVWDLVGKAIGQPIYRLLGGTPTLDVPAYATGLYYSRAETPAALLSARLGELETYMAHGFTGVKMKIGGLSERDDLVQVERIREAAGTDVFLMVDANQAYDREAARRVARSLESLDVLWLEEPLPNEDLAGLREIRSATSVPLAGGELDSTRSAFRAILEARALDILQPDLCMVGGFSELVRIWHLAEAWHARCCPHVWGSAVALTAALHFVATLPSARTIAEPTPIVQTPALELDQTPNPLRDELCPGAPRPEGGKLRVPDAPGLGIEVDAAAVERFRVG
jgi:D-galactarolactone cycloisomerase